MASRSVRVVVALGVCLLAGCGQPSAIPTHPAPSASQSPAATASITLASPGPSASASSAAASGVVDFSCRLPLVRTVGQSSEAGFITFPGGTFSPDPAGNIKSRTYGLAFDRVFNRWLPVDWRFVSDDGLHYAYAVYPDSAPAPGLNSVIHVVDVSTGRDRVVLSTGQYAIVDYTAGGIYLTPWVGGHDGPGPQVGWVLDPGTGSLRALNGGEKYGYWISGGAGWRTDYNPADPTVHQGMTGPNRLTRVDLATGGEYTWYYQQGADSLQLMGFDRHGVPIVASIVGSTWTVWLMPSTADQVKLYSTADYSQSATADAHGIWLTSSSGTYLYDAVHGLRRVSPESGQIAGGCH